MIKTTLFIVRCSYNASGTVKGFMGKNLKYLRFQHHFMCKEIYSICQGNPISLYNFLDSEAIQTDSHRNELWFGLEISIVTECLFNRSLFQDKDRRSPSL